MRALDDQLVDAAAGADVAAVMRLAGEGASADAKNMQGEPAVFAAAEQGRTEVVEALLRLGCDPNAPNRHGMTALMCAAYNGYGGVVGALLEHGGADLDAVDYEGKTALMWAALHGRAAVAAQLRLALGFFQSERLAAHCPLELEPDVSGTIAACFRVTLPAPPPAFRGLALGLVSDSGPRRSR